MCHGCVCVHDYFHRMGVCSVCLDGCVYVCCGWVCVCGCCHSMYVCVWMGDYFHSVLWMGVYFHSVYFHSVCMGVCIV